MLNKTTAYIIAALFVISSIVHRVFINDPRSGDKIRQERFNESFYGRVINYTLSKKGSMVIELDSGLIRSVHVMGGGRYEQYFYPWGKTYLRKFEYTTEIELLRKDSTGELYIIKTFPY